MKNSDLIAVTVFTDTTSIFSKDGDDNICELLYPKAVVKEYFMDNILESFRGDDTSVSDDGLFDEWLNEYTADATVDLVEYAKAKGYKEVAA